MSAISGVTSTTTNTATTAANDANQLSADYNNFLILLTTQLQNQDPLDPMDSSEFTNQLVQFSQVEQQIKTNTGLSNIMLQQENLVASGSLAFIGKAINFSGNEPYFNGTDPVAIGYTLEGNAQSSKLYIKDEDGNVIRTMTANNAAGSYNAVWDGKDNSGQLVEKGKYKVTVDALDSNGDAVKTTTEVNRVVTGIEKTDTDIILYLEGGGSVGASGVLAVQEKGAAAAAAALQLEEAENDTSNTSS